MALNSGAVTTGVVVTVPKSQANALVEGAGIGILMARTDGASAEVNPCNPGLERAECVRDRTVNTHSGRKKCH